MTLFVVGELAAGEEGPALKRLLDETPDLHDVNSHTWSHSRLICKNPWSLPVPTPEFIHDETARGVAAIRDRFDRPCRGFRPRSGAGCGFRGCPENLFALRASGCEWSSAYLKSAFEDSLPGDLHGPFSYADDGYDDLLELPGHGWQDALVKDYGRGLQYAVRWPSPFDYPRRLVETPAEEFAVHRRTLDAAEEAGLPFCCFVFHPWTMIRRQDPGRRVHRPAAAACARAGARGHDPGRRGAPLPGAAGPAVAGAADSAAAHPRLRCRPTLRLSPRSPEA